MQEERLQIVVSVNDDALDTERMTHAEMRRYVEARDYDLVKDRIKPGRRLQQYHTREVTRRMLTRFVLEVPDEAERFERAFMCGVVEVKNVLQRDGSILPAWKPSTKDGNVSEEDLERFPETDVMEVGSVILQRSFLAPRTVRAYQLPLTCQHALAQREFRLADATPPSPAPSSSAASSDVTPARSAETTTAPSSSANAFGSPTPATAVAPFQEAAANPQ